MALVNFVTFVVLMILGNLFSMQDSLFCLHILHSYFALFLKVLAKKNRHNDFSLIGWKLNEILQFK